MSDDAPLLVEESGGVAWLSDLVNGDAFTGSSSTPAAVAGYPSLTVPAGQLRGGLAAHIASGHRRDASSVCAATSARSSASALSGTSGEWPMNVWSLLLTKRGSCHAGALGSDASTTFHSSAPRPDGAARIL